jgi:hypothetical protein
MLVATNASLFISILPNTYTFYNEIGQATGVFKINFRCKNAYNLAVSGSFWVTKYPDIVKCVFLTDFSTSTR